MDIAGGGERFRIESRLGSGSFGEVYKAIGTTTGTEVAVKMAPEHKVHDPATLAVRTVLNEARIGMMKVNHPNVVSVLHVDTGSDPSVGPYLIMEYVSGGNLHELLDAGRRTSKSFSLEDAVSVMHKIAEGAKAINEYIVHRDVKPR